MDHEARILFLERRCQRLLEMMELIVRYTSRECGEGESRVHKFLQKIEKRIQEERG
jgi:hypothetical protein